MKTETFRKTAVESLSQKKKKGEEERDAILFPKGGGVHVFRLQEEKRLLCGGEYKKERKTKTTE